ncbi:MAG: O-GlcNAc transferase [Verrucomicrobiota bacterium]|jgi:Flp pilus assembly protein TadD
MKQRIKIKPKKAVAAAQVESAPSPEMTQAPQLAQSSPNECRMEGFQNRIFKAALIILACLWVYSPTYHGDWLWDDDQMLTANLTVQHRLSPDPNVPTDSLGTLKKLWVDPDGADYFPLSYTVLWAQWPFFGMESTGYHVTTILFHTAGALLFWVLLAKMRIPGAWLSGLVFAIHPICIESVAWISEIKNTLSMPLFMLSCMYWVGQDEESNAFKRKRLYVLSIVFFLLSMLAKTSIVAFPVVTLLYAWWKRSEITKRDIMRSLPLFAISIVLGLVTIHYQWGRAIGEEKIIIGNLLSLDGFLSRMAISGMGVFHYIATVLWPVGLLPIYPRWEVDPPKFWMLLAWPLFFAGLWWIWRKRNATFPSQWGHHALFVIGFFLLMVAPVLGFVTISYMRITWVADHFVYKPMISIVAFACAGLVLFFNRLKDSPKRGFCIAGSVLLLAFACLAFRQSTFWQDEDHMWEYTLKHNNNAWQAHNRLGAKKSSRGDLDGAHYHFQNATRLRPDLGETHNNLASSLLARSQIFQQKGDQAAAEREGAEAIHHASEACRLTPSLPIFHVNLANALLTLGRFPEAEAKYKEILGFAPNDSSVLNNCGVALCKQGKNEEAIPLFRRALEITPNLKDASDNLASALGNKDNPNGASTVPSPEGKPGELKYDKSVADSLTMSGRIAEAAEIYLELLKKEPNNPALINNYGFILYRQGKSDEAIAKFRRALELDPNLKDAKENLAIAMGQKPASPANVPLSDGDKKQSEPQSAPPENNSAPK